jgi:hypothetical protein
MHWDSRVKKLTVEKLSDEVALSNNYELYLESEREIEY